MQIEGMDDALRLLERIECRLGGGTPGEIEKSLFSEKVRSILEAHRPTEQVLATAAFDNAAREIILALENV